MSDADKAQGEATAPYESIPPHDFAGFHATAAAADIGERLRFRDDLRGRGILDAAMIRKDSDTLVVTFHGALDRAKYAIPRFERVRTTEPFGTSCLYWADPSLWLDQGLSLSWYTGRGDFDLFPLIADRSRAAADALGAKRIVFTGSSGGGFAALQTSALVPGSTALVFNPQSAISRYWKTVQREYLRLCQPQILAELDGELEAGEDWSAEHGDRFSAVRRYSAPTKNHVFYWTNVNDWHHVKHFRPFRDAVKRAGSDRLTVRTYEGAKGHQTPSSALFTEAMTECLASADAGS